MKEILDRLRAIRFFRKMNQTEFANKLKMAQNTYSHIETGKSPLTDKNIALICLTFGVNENWLRTGRGEMFGSPAPDLPVKGLSQDGEFAEDNDDINANTYEINSVLGSTAEDYPKSINDDKGDILFSGGWLHMDRTKRKILFTYSYDKYYETGEIPFYVLVLFYGKGDKKVLPVRIDRIQVQDKDYDQLVMISDDIEYNTKDTFRIKITKTK